MKHEIRAGLSFLALGITLAASGATAGPLPDPPFAGGGYNASDKHVLKQEELVNRLLGAYMKKRTMCDRVAVTILQLAYTPANPAKVATIQAKWLECVLKSVEYFTEKSARLVAKGTPACLDQAGIDAQRAVVEDVLSSLAGQVYCDDDGAAPDPVTGLDIPDKKQETIGETEVAKVVLKASLSAGKCYSKAASVVFKDGGTLDPSGAAKIQACLDRVALKAVAAIADLEQQQKLPTCLPAPVAEGAANQAVALATMSTAAIYCSSPSGAFLDGVAPL